MDNTQAFDIFPSQSQYRPGQPVKLEVEGLDTAVGNGSVEIAVMRYHQSINTLTVPTHQLRDGQNIVDLGVYPAGGYHVIARYQSLEAKTAFDVKLRWREAPRYGFLSDYHLKSSYQDIQHFFRKFHLNVVQFYDWMERHDAPVPTAAEFVDPMGRTLITDGILSRIHAMRDIQTATIGYAAVYAALADYAKSHPNEGIYDNHGVQYSLIDIFYLMDISDGSPWREHILEEFAKVIDFGFDGLHLDQYGYPKSALRQDASALWMDEAYTSFINACRLRLGEQAGLIFNNVSSYPVHATHKALQDALYVEVWPPMVRYRHLTELITRIRLSSAATKQVILAAYLKPFREHRDANPDAVARSALLVTAIIYASGGYHLVLGESGGMLTEPYYPDYVPMAPQLAKPLRSMYDMVTADADLLSGPDVTDVTWSFTSGINDTVIVDGAPTSVEPEPGSVWVRVTITHEGLVIHLVNLLWLESDEWNAIHDQPFRLTPPVEVRIEWNHPVRDVLVQRAEDGVWERANPSFVPHVRGEALRIAVKPFEVWTMIFVPFATE